MLTSSLSSRAHGCGLSRPVKKNLCEESDRRFHWVSHFFVVIFPITPTNYLTVSHYPPSSVSNLSITTECLQIITLLDGAVKCASSKKRLALTLR